MKGKISQVWVMGLLLLGLMMISCSCGKEEVAVGDMVFSEPEGAVAAETAAMQGIAAIDQQIETQFDPYAVYYNKTEYQELFDSIVGEFNGIGIYIYEDETTGRVTISNTIKDGPAYQAGLQPGDQILEIDGEDVRSQTSEYVSVRFKSYDVGKKVTLLLNRPGKGQIEVTMKVEKVDLPTLEGTVLADTPELGLIKIVSFTQNTGEQFLQEWEKLVQQGVKGIIVDLRDNGGGEVTAALQVCDMFIEKGQPLMYVTNPSGTFYYEAETAKTDIPVVALQNGNTASASEIVLGAIQDSGSGKTVGETSYGKGVMQELVQLESGAGLKYTNAKYKTAGERDINQVGIIPDVEFAMPEGTSFYAGWTMDPEQDPQLAKAVEVLQQEIQVASNNNSHND